MSADLSPAEQARAARWAADWIARNTLCGYSPDEVNQCLLSHANRIDPPETVESLRAERDDACLALNAMRDERDAALVDRMDFQRERYRIAAALDIQTQELDATRETVESLRAELEESWRNCIRTTEQNERVVAELEEVRAECDEARASRVRAEVVISDQRVAHEAMRDERDAAQRRVVEDDRLITRLRAERDEGWRTILDLRDELEQRKPRVWHVGDAQPDDAERVRDALDKVWWRAASGWQRVDDDRIPMRTWGQLGPVTEVLP